MKKIRKACNYINRFIKKMNDNHINAYASQSAFFIILSFIPFVVIMANLVRHIPNLQHYTTTSIVNGIPSEARYLVRSVINEIYAKSSSFVPINIIAALWSVGKGFQAMTNGLNVINNVSETRSFILMRLRSILFTIIFMLAIIITLLLLVFGQSIQRILVAYVPFVSQITAFILSMSPLITMCMLALVFMLFYSFLPNKKQKIRKQIPGALLTAVFWTLFSYCISLYFTYFPNVMNMYGSLTAILLIMVWMHICMCMFMIGAEINELLEEREMREKIELLKEKAKD